VRVIARAAQVLRALEGEPQRLSLAQLAERVRLPRSTVHRIVSALATEGLLASVSSTGRVRIGPEFARPAAAGPAEFWRPVEPFMLRLHEQLGETIDCGMVDGGRVRVIHVIPTTRYTLRAIAEVGQAFPLYCSAKGKALLAQCHRDRGGPGQDDGDGRGLRAGGHQRLTPIFRPVRSLRRPVSGVPCVSWSGPSGSTGRGRAPVP
jgi:DNA-binding IclR family transcriptional regulator